MCLYVSVLDLMREAGARAIDFPPRAAENTHIYVYILYMAYITASRFHILLRCDAKQFARAPPR